MRTLVADDDPITATILSTTLARGGMEVTVAHDGDLAWQQLNSVQPPADLRCGATRSSRHLVVRREST